MDGSPESSISTSLRLMKALSLARHGKMRAAQALLGSEGTLPENRVELHALAALVTSEGDYPRALRLWRLLLEREPGHREARRMIAAIELWLSRPPWVRYVPMGAAVLLAVVIISVLASSGGSPPRASEPVPAARLVASPDSALSPVSQSQAGEAHARNVTPRPAAAPSPALTVPGLGRRRPVQ
jgi:hypothetical protein